MAFCIRDYHKKRRARARIVRCHHDSGNNKAASLLRLLSFKVSNRHGLAKYADMQGGTLVSPPSHLTDSSRKWTNISLRPRETFFFLTYCEGIIILRWATGKKLTNRLPKLSLIIAVLWKCIRVLDTRVIHPGEKACEWIYVLKDTVSDSDPWTTVSASQK